MDHLPKIETCGSCERDHARAIHEEIYAELTVGKPAVLRYLREKNYGQILRYLKKQTRSYMIQPMPYDRYGITPYTREVSETYKIEYVNASFVSLLGLYFIACQAPKEKYYNLFLEMVIRSNPSMIICLADESDYFSASQLVARKEVCYQDRLFLFDEVYVILGTKIRRIKCVCWADHSVLAFDEMQFLNGYILSIDDDPGSLKIIHCKAGVGRTGTFIMHRILSGIPNVTDEIFVDLLLRLRSFRPYLVENTCQVRFLAENFLK